MKEIMTYSEQLKDIIRDVNGADSKATERVVFAVRDYPLLLQLEAICAEMNCGQGVQFNKSQLNQICNILVELQAMRPSLSNTEDEPSDNEDAIVHGENCGCKSFDDCPAR